MIYKEGKETSAITALLNSVQEVWRGVVLKWQGIRSCFGRGYWIQEKPWIDTDKWKNER